ncbi:MAG: ATP-dependent DNA helicase UvrD2 [Actinomycetia bacterium]|nr:ATP-dependent DNA helicase UvrD2 [Actinomycetes bacterium]MCP4962939.1 ATP-dependent DNA helicase UvrD2 [Actinomycetes bacterium]
MASIHCGNCGGIHPSVTEVRNCHSNPTEHALARDDGFPEELPGHLETEPVQVEVGPTNWADAAPATRGPDRLGRSVVVNPGAPAPDGWQGCPRIEVDCSDPDPDVLAQLHEAWLSRSSVVVEVRGDIPTPEQGPSRPIWSIPVGLDLRAERLAFLLTANAVDGRDKNPRWHPISLALSLGASLDDRADVVLPDGSTAWIDGGPPDLDRIDDVAIIPTTHLEHGSLTPHHIGESDADLAPDQMEAVSHVGGAARIVAPAGSGKTRVLTERARHLLKDRGVPARSLILVAFNKRAQLEMKERTTDLPDLKVSTLNALGLAILRGTGPFARPSNAMRSEVIDERTVRRILDDLLELRRRANADPLAVWIEALTAVRLGLRDPVEVERTFGGDVDGLPALVERYRDTLRAHGLVDFDEQIIGAIEALLVDPHARSIAQKACRIMLVDEFQDLTPAHMLLIRLLAGPASNVFGVGDDDQTIYGFTGATPDWLIGYDRWFPGATTHHLEVNYRCPVGVVEAAANLLTHNGSRVDKNIRAAPERKPDPADLSVNITDEPVRCTAELVTALCGDKPKEVMVLTRVNASLAPVQIALRAAGTPVVKAVDTRFLERTGVKAALAWLRLATARRLDPSDVAVAARRPSRGLSARVIEWMGEQKGPQDLRRLADRIRERDGEKVLEFIDDLEVLRVAAQRGDQTIDLLVLLRDEIGLAGSLDHLDGSRRSVDRSTHGDDLAALVGLASFHPDPATFEFWLATELEAPGDPEGVRLSTVHRVKGREWPHVVVTAVDEGRFPHRLCSDIEEERRVFHVAITRSSRSCTIVADATAPSRFLSELEQPGSPAIPARVKGPEATAGTSPGSDDLRDELRTWRRTRASSDGVPAFVVFNDRTLDDLVRIRPTDARSLRRVHGFGPAKVAKYGDDLVSIVGAHQA